jgi:cellulose synthase/poly-beta-1,6-N-acetylglucosamine synthase-like glycosyltransferase
MNPQLAFILLRIAEMLYAICVISLFLIGLNNFIVVIIYIKNRKKGWTVNVPQLNSEWPIVTVQIPIYNERYLSQRIITAVSNLDYPREKLEIQVLDDSTDWTTSLLIKLVAEYRKKGIDIKYLHRVDRLGYKAGNLAFGTKVAKGEFMAIFDADFIPPRDWLKKTVPFFQDDEVGFVQTRWDHLNFQHNIITKMAGLTLDAHFIVEQIARSTSGLIMGFNGSAGIWRKAAIQSVGGWQWDTMTEDVDMTFRSQIAGWKGRYNVRERVPAELPQGMDDFKLQQYRWCRGTAQVSFKLMGKVLESKMPMKKKFMSMLHLLSFLTFPLLIILLLLVLPISLWSPNFLHLFWWGGLAGVGPLLLFSLPATEHAPTFSDRMKILPYLLLIGVGISLVCGLSVFSGAIYQGKGGTFIRTARADPRIRQAYDTRKKRILNLFIIGELALAVYLILTLGILWQSSGPYLAPWLGSSALGFLFVAFASLIQRFSQQEKKKIKS